MYKHEDVHLRSYRGQRVIIFFYPKSLVTMKSPILKEKRKIIPAC